jgi:telomere length regulation protein
VPAYWNVFQASLTSKATRKQVRANESSDLGLLLSCLRSVIGLNAILLNIKQFIRQSKENRKNKIIGGPKIQDVLEILLHTLSTILEGNGTIEAISNNIWMASGDSAKQRAVWTEFLSIISGKILGISAEAEDIVNELSDKIGEKHWTANGGLYSTWLACNISHWSQTLDPDNEHGWKICSEFLGRSLRLGQTGLKLTYGFLTVR